MAEGADSPRAHFNLLTTTATDLQTKLNAGHLTSVDLVNSYLAQIAENNDYLRAVFETAPRALLTQLAKQLDDERQAGNLRSTLHGIPILIKDNTATHPDLGMSTTCGNYAIAESRPALNAALVDRLMAAGIIILGKAALSELNYMKGEGIPCGWSAIGGQTQSPYVRGGYREDDSVAGHSNCGGSSSGSGVSVAAGFAPFAIGTELEGSLTLPATRAALYTIKATAGIIPAKGIFPIFPGAESAGPMTKNVADLAHLLDILVDGSKTELPTGGYVSAMTDTFADLRLGVVDPDLWQFEPDFVKPDEGATRQMYKHQETRAAYLKLKGLAKDLREVKLPSLEALEYNGSSSLISVFYHHYKVEFENHLAELKTSPVRTLQELIEYNKENAEKELPSKYPSQSCLVKALTSRLSAEEYEKTFAHMRRWGRDHGIDGILKDYDLDVIIGPADSELTQLSSASGYPLATMPLSYLDLNGRPFGMVALAGGHQEATLIKLLSAWEATFPKRHPPPSMT